ncbi:MAG: Jag N-terminal domain-containing protein [Bacilli bacterium]|nr:Jag N-terminal domain-containing protein [Bacilli bacterium]
MKTYEAKSIEEAVEAAATEMNVAKENVHYIIKEEKGGILGLGKSATIEVYTLEDVYNYGADYLKNAIKAIGIDVNITAQINDEGIIRMTINSERNPILIGRNGRTLRALNDLVRLAVSNHFKRRYRVLLDVGDYKDKKYSKIIGIARRVAKEVSHQHIDVKLDPMTSDERRMIHQVLTDFHDITTESEGEGERRAVVIKYTGPEEHAFQQSEVYYKDIIHDRPRRSHDRRPREIRGDYHHEEKPANNNSLNDLLHNSDSDFLKEKPAETAAPVAEENQAKEADKSIDDLPSASITSPIIDTSKLNDLEDKPAEEKPAEVKPEENK